MYRCMCGFLQGEERGAGSVLLKFYGAKHVGGGGVVGRHTSIAVNTSRLQAIAGIAEHLLHRTVSLDGTVRHHERASWKPDAQTTLGPGETSKLAVCMWLAHPDRDTGPMEWRALTLLQRSLAIVVLIGHTTDMRQFVSLRGTLSALPKSLKKR